MAPQRRYSIEFKRQIVQEYQAGESLHGLAKRHGSRNLVRIWAAKAEAGDDLAAANILHEYEARIGALENNGEAHLDRKAPASAAGTTRPS